MAAPVFAPIFAPLSGNYDTGALATCVATVAGTYTTPFYPNLKARGIKVVVDITAITGTLTVTIEGYDNASGKKYTILASAALAGTGTTVLTVYPGAVVTANASANDHLPAVFDIKLVSATGPFTATISASLLD